PILNPNCGLEGEQARNFLSGRGHRVLRSLNAAQCVVAGPGAEPSLLEQSRARGLEVVAWDAIREAVRDEGLLAGLMAPGGNAPLRECPIEPLLCRDGDGWRLMDRPLPRAAIVADCDRKYIPQAGRFAGLCFDQPFVETLQAVLTGMNHAMPVALEGETAASKTTAVLYLAHLLQQPVIRLNLNGQTDSGELVGRFVPSGKGWRFQEGALPAAMRRGHWLLLDEMNLAEPQVLERLNCALEHPPTLVLSEGHGTVFGPGGDVEVAENFRLLATLNPAEYSGRSILSPAFRNRWLVWHQAQAADEAAILTMLRTLVTGEQPVVCWRGKSYQADATPALFPQLQDMADVESVLARFAMFHCTVAAAAGAHGTTPGLARHRRERHVFTRRNLIAALQLCDRSSNDPRRGLSDAIQQIYIDRYPDAADRKAVHAHLRAAELA
ncbi:MAG: AAA family ATPase, partial [Luteolibacter sp.]